MTAQVSATGDLLQTWASSGDVVTPAQPKINQGWIFGEEPPHGTLNWIHNSLGQKINHILTRGIALWDSATVYGIGSLVEYANIHYISATVNLNKAPDLNPSDWSQYAKKIVAGSAAITVTPTAATNTSTIDISGSGLVSKFENSSQITWSSSAGKAKASYVSPSSVQITNTNATLVATDIGRNIYWSTGTSGGGTGNYTLTLPSAASVPDGWFIDISVLNVGNLTGGLLKLAPNGTDQLIRSNVQENTSVNFIKGTKNTNIRVYKLAGTNIFDVTGLSEASFEEAITTAITGGTLISRGYSLVGNTLHQWVNFASQQNTFPVGGRAHIVGVPLALPYNNRYSSVVSVDDDSNVPTSVAYSGQSSAYAYSGSPQQVTVGSYYNLSGIRLYLTTIGLSTGFRG